MMSPEEFRHLARQHYQNDHSWLSKIASDLGVHPRTVRRWAEGECPITDRIEKHIMLVFGHTRAVK